MEREKENAVQHNSQIADKCETRILLQTIFKHVSDVYMHVGFKSYLMVNLNPRNYAKHYSENNL